MARSFHQFPSIKRNIMTRSPAFIAACVVMMSAANNFAYAFITIPPPSVNPGDSYRLAFATSGTRDATSTNIADYNTFVTNAATAVTALKSLATTWTAIGSTETVDARDNTNTVPSTVTGGSLGVPIFRLDGFKVADSYDDLWDGSIDNALLTTELNGVANQRVWTGTDATGKAAADPFEAELGNLEVVVYGNGHAAGLPISWWIWEDVSFSPQDARQFYAISGVLQVPFPVPEPGTFTLFGLGLIALLAHGRRRRA